MENEGLTSPLLLKYLKKYEKDPSSRVFAPLAESYRKLGLVDKAVVILQDGLRSNPRYILGYLCLALCYDDLGKIDIAYSTLLPWIEDSRDNIRLQKLFAKLCLDLGHYQQALETFKILLFLNPKDKDVAERVKDLEDNNENYVLLKNDNYTSDVEVNVNINDISSDLDEFDGWEQVSFLDVDKSNTGDLKKNEVSLDDDYFSDDVEYDGFVQTSLHDLNDNSDSQNPTSDDLYPSAVDSVEELENISARESTELQDELNSSEIDEVNKKSIEFAEDNIAEVEFEKAEKDDAPVITHTLVDLYCAQGYSEKAIEILEQILELNPGDQRTIDKLTSIKNSLYPMGPKNSEELGRKKLLDIIDIKVHGISEESYDKIKNQMNDFLYLIKERSVEKLSSS